jgi:copper homeostasis protein
MLLEICAGNYESAFNAHRSGIKRIELCSELSVGGITPSYGLLKQTVELVSLEIMVLIRPRSGDFNYTASDFDIMKEDIRLCKLLGCHGIVSGVLHANGAIDKERTQELIALSKPLPFIFHRAFDHVPDQLHGLETLVELGAKRVLTSGGAPRAIDGIAQLKKLKNVAQNRICIMPGGGINVQNIKRFREAGFTEIHAALTTLVKQHELELVPMNSPKNLQENSYLYTQEQSIKELIAII